MLLVMGHMIYLCLALCTLKPKKPKKPKYLKIFSKKPRFFPALVQVGIVGFNIPLDTLHMLYT